MNGCVPRREVTGPYVVNDALNVARDDYCEYLASEMVQWRLGESGIPSSRPSSSAAEES